MTSQLETTSSSSTEAGAGTRKPEVEIQTAEPRFRWRVLRRVSSPWFSVASPMQRSLLADLAFMRAIHLSMVRCEICSGRCGSVRSDLRIQNSLGADSLYPLPTVIVTLPVAWLPVRAAAAVFLGISCGLLAFLATKRSGWRLIMFASAPFFGRHSSPRCSPLPGCVRRRWVSWPLNPNLHFPCSPFRRANGRLASLLASGLDCW
jgi:hypothetical protein